jgi:hypothetical protein
LIGALAWLVLLADYGWGIYWGKLADRRLAAADRDDRNWQIEDLVAQRVPVPDAENSAFVVGDVVSVLPENRPGR